MHKRLVALVVALSGTAFLVGGCATLDQPSSAGYTMPGTTVPTVGASGAPGEDNPDQPASAGR